MLGGSLAAGPAGGPESTNDLDLFVQPEDAERALEVLVARACARSDPPEDWLLKAWDGEVLIDLIFDPLGLTIDDSAVRARAAHERLLDRACAVMRLEDVIATKLMSLNDHYLDYAVAARDARAVREQVDWAEVRARTAESPYARAFFALLRELGRRAADARPQAVRTCACCRG